MDFSQLPLEMRLEVLQYLPLENLLKNYNLSRNPIFIRFIKKLSNDITQVIKKLKKKKITIDLIFDCYKITENEILRNIITNIIVFCKNNTTQIRIKYIIPRKFKSFVDEFQNELRTLQWDYIIAKYTLSEKFMNYYADNLNWEIIFQQKRKFSDAFYSKHIDKINKLNFWWHLTYWKKVNEYFLDKHSNVIDFAHISYKHQFSNTFLEKYFLRFDLNPFCFYQKVPKELLDQYANIIDWDIISLRQNLSEEFIHKHRTRVSWSFICEYQKLSEPFIDEHCNEVDWNNVYQFQKLSEKFIKKHEKNINFNLFGYRHQKCLFDIKKNYPSFQCVVMDLLQQFRCNFFSYIEIICNKMIILSKWKLIYYGKNLCMLLIKRNN